MPLRARAPRCAVDARQIRGEIPRMRRLHGELLRSCAICVPAGDLAVEPEQLSSKILRRPSSVLQRLEIAGGERLEPQLDLRSHAATASREASCAATYALPASDRVAAVALVLWIQDSALRAARARFGFGAQRCPPSALSAAARLAPRRRQIRRALSSRVEQRRDRALVGPAFVARQRQLALDLGEALALARQAPFDIAQAFRERRRSTSSWVRAVVRQAAPLRAQCVRSERLRSTGRARCQVSDVPASLPRAHLISGDVEHGQLGGGSRSSSLGRDSSGAARSCARPLMLFSPEYSGGSAAEGALSRLKL